MRLELFIHFAIEEAHFRLVFYSKGSVVLRRNRGNGRTESTIGKSLGLIAQNPVVVIEVDYEVGSLRG